jgi:RHS repeat-associated protein
VAAWISNGSQLTVPIQDRIGSTVGLVGSSGALGTQYQYEPYGKASSSGQASVYPYQFAGTEQDTGLYHLQYRYYSPGLARFISQDPLGVSGSGVNLFAYANDDPVNQVDPLGMDSFCPNGDCTGGSSTNQNPSGGGGFSLLNFFIGLFQDLFGGGGGHPTPSRKLTLGGEHNPASKLLGAQKGIAPNQHNGVSLPGKTKPEPQYQAPPTPQYLPMPAPQYAPMPAPKPTAPPPSYSSCFWEQFGTAVGASDATLCLASVVGCTFTGAPPACILGFATCGYGVGVEAYCYSQSTGNNPPPLPPFAPPEGLE